MIGTLYKNDIFSMTFSRFKDYFLNFHTIYPQNGNKKSRGCKILKDVEKLNTFSQKMIHVLLDVESRRNYTVGVNYV